MLVRPPAPFTVQFDIAITRRLKMHAICDAEGIQIFHSKRIAEIFAWLLEQEAGEFRMVDEDIDFLVTIKPPPSPSPIEKG